MRNSSDLKPSNDSVKKILFSIIGVGLLLLIVALITTVNKSPERQRTTGVTQGQNEPKTSRQQEQTSIGAEYHSQNTSTKKPSSSSDLDKRPSDEELRQLGIDPKALETPVPRVFNEVRSLRIAIEQYKSEYGQYPTGTDLQISKKLQGENPNKIVFIDWHLDQMTEEGLLLDPWNHPYRVGIKTTGVIEIVSSGPDGIFGNEDDETYAK